MSSEENTVLWISCRGSEYTPDRNERYFSFYAAVRSGAFTEETSFYASASHIAHFAEQLASFYRSLTPDPEFSAGWGTEAYFTLKFSRLDLHGHIRLDCECRQPALRQPGSGEGIGEHFKGVHIYEALEIYQIHHLERFFRGLLDRDVLDWSQANAEAETVSLRSTS